MKAIKLLLFFIGIIRCRSFSVVDGPQTDSRKGKILNGDLAEEGQFPYLVSIYHSYVHVCGGGIIADKFILTAAHCIFYHSSKEFVDVPIEIVVDTAGVVENTGTRIAVEKVYILKEFDHPYQAHDIGLIKLSESLDLSNNAKRRKLDLPQGDANYVGRDAVIAGWGRTDPDDSSSAGNHVYYSTARIVSNKECYDTHKNTRLNVTENHICARLSKTYDNIPAGVCRGDSGSPLVIDGNTVIGITSTNAEKCDERTSPSRYIRVSKYLPFIQSVITGKLNNNIIEYVVPLPYKPSPTSANDPCNFYPKIPGFRPNC